MQNTWKLNNIGKSIVTIKSQGGKKCNCSEKNTVVLMLGKFDLCQGWTQPEVLGIAVAARAGLWATGETLTAPPPHN